MDIEKSLESLGLTHIEALAYAYLVANPSSTGYRVARGIGKPTANVYRALEGLGRKGAVLRDRTATPSFRALAPDDLLARLEGEFQERKAHAARQLASLQPDEEDERVYALQTFEQILARVRILLASARKLVLMDTAADVTGLLEDETGDARKRGVRVLIRVRDKDGDVADAHRDTFVDARHPPGVPPSLRMVADAREVLMSWYGENHDHIRDAFWTRSPLIARTMHEAMTSERCCAQIDQKMVDGLSVDEVEEVFEAWRRLLTLV